MPVSALPAWVVAALLGALQGATEFLPISSSAHLIIARRQFGWTFGSQDANLLFDVAVHVGTTIAIVAYFRNDLWRLLTSLFARDPQRRWERRTALAILAATIPAAAVGVFFNDWIVEFFRQQIVVIAALLAGVGVLMWVADRLGRQAREMRSVGFWDAILIGCAQATALMPGVSRSGVTITTGLGLGLKRETAARFSFLLSTPAVVGAAVWTVKDAASVGVPASFVGVMGVGFVASLLVGFASIAFLLGFLRKRTVLAFTLYRLALAAYLFAFLVRV
jgi:undecaprenyl-diphosphatase